MVAAVVVKSQQSFAKHYEEEEGYEGEEGQRCGVEMYSRMELPSLYLSTYRGREEEGAP